MYDVIVIGGGPIGSYLSYKLAGMGHAIAVVERRERVGEKFCCTGIIGWECAVSFPIAENVILRRANSARIFSPSGTSVRVWRDKTQAFVVDRSAFDRAMAQRAQNRGAGYLLGTLAERIRRENDRVIVETRQRGTLEGRAVVIASGFGLRFTEKMQLGRVTDFVAGAQADVEAKIDEIEVYFGQSVAPGFFAWLVPTSPGRALAGLLARRNPGLHLKNFLSFLKTQGKIASTDVKIRYGGIPLKPLPRTYDDRILVVGDAAGQVKPTTGGGIYYGLLSADAAVKTLHQALISDNLSAKYLANYEREWKKTLSRELALGYQARRFYERLSDGEINKIFDIISRGVDKTLLDEHLSFDWHGEVLARLWPLVALHKPLELVKMQLSLWRQYFRF